jgi:hypothetical protein
LFSSKCSGQEGDFVTKAVLTKEAFATTSVVEKSHDASNVVVVSKETLAKKKVIIFKSVLFIFLFILGF